MAVTRLPEGMSDDEKLAYCKKVVRNRNINDFHKEEFRKEKEILFDDVSKSFDPNASYYDTYSYEYQEIIVERYIMRIRDEALAKAVDALHMDKKEIIAKSFFYFIPDKQIADEKGISCEALRKRKSRIYEELRRLYGGLK